MNKLKQKRNLALFGIILLVMMITGIFAVSRYDRFKGLVKIKNANIKLLSDVSIPTNIKGTEEIKYEVKYTLDRIENVSKRDVVITGELNSKYARFKSINNKKISSNVTNDGKKIELTIKDVPLGEEQNINLTINVVNAPNNEEINPIIKIKELTGDYTRLETESLLVETNSITGTCYDENNLEVEGIELSLLKNGNEVKRTYTDINGNFVFSDLEEGKYSVKVEEDIYEIINDSSSTENNDSLLLILKQVDKFNIETHKFITNLKLIVDGKENNYSYEDAEKIVKSIKKFNNVSGEIEYKIVVKNNSDKSTMIREVVDDLDEALSFNKAKNPGWEITDSKIKFLPLEDVILEPFEKREVKIKLDIRKTSELKTYINKLTTKRDINEKVVFILDGKEIRNINVLEGRKIEKPNLGEDIVWYTDVNKSNEYNFNKTVTRDLILYGFVKEPEIGYYSVTFIDQDDLFYEEEVEENMTANGIANIPTKPHCIFLGWYLDDELFNFDTLITDDITLQSKFEEVEAPEISYSPDGWVNGDGVLVSLSTNHDDYTYMYKIGDGNYTKYIEPFRLHENDMVYAYSIKDDITSVEVAKTINMIDNINPSIISMELNDITPISANLNINILDEQSGINKYKVYVDNTLIFESNTYTTNLNEEKIETYLISNLDELNTYIIKLEALDVVGNKTIRELTLETPAKHYVARTLNYQNEEIERYESLKEAIDSNTCLLNCYIEMLDNVEETNIINQDQNIVLDLNGKTITGVSIYAFKNNGNLNIVDYNENSVGKVLSNNIAIINNGILQIGENEIELEVSIETPVIGGSTYGVDNSGILRFYDGLLMGTTPVHGNIDDTPFLYNAIIDEQDSIQIAKLDKVANAVARVNSVYYTEAQSAVDETVNGTYEEVDYTKPLIEQLRSSDTYRFVNDEEGGGYINTNRWSNNTLAHSYIQLDLTNYSDNQAITVNAEIDVASNDYGYITITESIDTPSYSQTNGRFVYLSGSVSSKDYSTILQKGKKYYLHICLQKGNSNSGIDIFRINSITLGNFKQVEFANLSDVIMYNDPTIYSFEKQEDGTYINTNSTIGPSYAHSYFIVDLTNVNEDKFIYVYLETSGVNSDQAWITVNNITNAPGINDSGRQVFITGTNAENKYSIKLTKNNINVVHINYRKSTANGESKLIVKKIRPYYLVEGTSNFTSGEMVSSEDYYFVKQEDGSYVSNNHGVANSVAHSYLIMDMTSQDTSIDLILDVSVSSEAKYDYGYITLTETPDKPNYNDSNGRYYFAAGVNSSAVLITLEPGKIYYVHFGYRKDGSADRNEDQFKINNIQIRDESKHIDISYIDYNIIKTENYSTSDSVPVLNEEPETVQLVRNVTLTEPLEIDETRNVILDLNGKTLTTSAEDYVINNSGNLKIIDSDYYSQIDLNTINYNNQQAAYDETYEQELQEYNSALKAQQDIYDLKYNHEMDIYNAYLEALENYDPNDPNSVKPEKPFFNQYDVNDYINDESLKVHLDGLNPENTASVWKNLATGEADGEVRNAIKEDDSYYFDGAADYIYLGDHNYEYVSVEAVVDLEVFNKRQSIFVNMNYGGYQFDITANGNLRFSYAHNTRVNWESVSTNRLTDDKVYYAATYDGKTIKVYINGVCVASSARSGKIYLTEGGMPLMVGGNYNDDSLKGHIYSARLYNRGLTEDEIRHNYEVDKDRYLDYNEVPIRRIATSRDIGMEEPVRQTAVMGDSYLNGTVTSNAYHVINNDYSAYLNVESGNIVLDKEGNYNAITNNGQLVLGKDAYVKTYKRYNRGVSNSQGGILLDGLGTITTSGRESKGILNNSINDTKIKGYTVNSLDSTSFSLYNIGYHDIIFENITTGGAGADIFHDTDRNITFNNCTFGSTGNDSFYPNTSGNVSSVTFNNCTIKNRINNRTESHRIINIIDSNIYTGNMDNAINNINGVINLKNTNIYNISGKRYEINNKGELNIDGGSLELLSTVSNASYGIYNLSPGVVNIKGNFSTNDSYNYGIYNTGQLTIGNNEDSVSISYPLIQGTTSAIYNSLSSTFNYYDGKLVGPNNNSLEGIVSNTPLKYDLNVLNNNSKEIITLKSYSESVADNSYVASIGNNKYSSIQEAITACNDNVDTEIVLLKDVYTAKSNLIPKNKRIVLNQNGHPIRSYNDTTAFTNNGVFTITDDDPNYNNVSYSDLVVNNNELNYNNIKTYAFSSNYLITNNNGGTANISDGELYTYQYQIIRNNGSMNINNSKLYATFNFGSNSLEYNLITNDTNGELIINESNITYLGKNSAIYNLGTVKVINSIGEFYGVLSSSSYTSLINNASSESYAKISGGTYGSTNKKGYLAYNNGTIDIENVTSYLNEDLTTSGTARINGGSFNSVKAITVTAGTLDIDGLTMTGGTNSHATINVHGSPTVNIKNSNITRSGAGTPCISSIYYPAIITIENSTLISKQGPAISLWSSSTATLNVVSGTIKSESGPAINVTNANGVVNIGTSGGEPSKTDPIITGTTYGLYNDTSSQVNFYDGIISGNTAIYGKLTAIEDGYDILLEKDGTLEHKYLGLSPVVMNKRTTEEFNTIKEAIDDAQDGDTLEFVREYTTNPLMETIENDKNIIIDLKGFKIQQNNTTLFHNSGTLTVTSSVDGGMIESNAGNIFINDGVLNIETGKYHQTLSNRILTNNQNGEVNITGGEFYTFEYEIIRNSGTLNIDNAKLYATNTSNSYSNWNLIHNEATGEIVANESEFIFTGKSNAIYNLGSVIATNITGDFRGSGNSNTYTPFVNNASATSYAKIVGGTFGSSIKKGMVINNSGTAELENVTSYLSETVRTSGNTKITGGAYDTNRSIIITAGTLDIDGLTITGGTNSHASINVQGTATINIKNSNITRTGAGTPCISAIYEPAVITIENSTLISKQGPAISLWSSSTATLNVVSGTIKSESGPAINVTNANGVVNIGTSGGEPSKTNPIITGTTYGLYNNTSSQVNFYDGIISGNTAIYGKISSLELGYDIILETEDNVEHKYLGLLPAVMNKRTTEEFNTIKEAIDDAQDGDTLELIREYTTNPLMETIENDKNIIIDLKGFKIQQNNTTLFHNSGTLTVTSSVDGGMIESNAGNIFINDGVLNIETGKYHQALSNKILTNNQNGEVNITGGEFYSYEYQIISNYGTMNIDNAKLYSTNTGSSNNSYNLIYNDTNGVLTINDSDFTFTGGGAVINNYGNLISTDVICNLRGYLSGNTIFIKNANSSSYAKISGGTFGETVFRGNLFENSGTLDITGEVKNYFNGNNIYSTAGTVNINNAILNQLKGYYLISITGSTELNITNSTITGTTKEAITSNGNSQVNVISGIINSTTTNAIILNGNSIVNVGVIGGIPSTSEPVIKGKTYGIYKNSSSSRINFYDGVISGETSPVYGSINDYEPGYKEDRNAVTDPNTGATVIESTLTVIGSESAAIIVNNINFMSIQSAVNYAVSNNISTLDLYKDITLSDNLIKPDGIDVNINLNGHTIDLNGYTIDSGINLITGNESNNNLGASIFTDNTNHENIVIYELSDGTKLSALNTYTLYKVEDGKRKIVKLLENKIGNYDIGNDITELHTVNGRIYINDLKEGSYILNSSDGNNLEFEILPDGVSSNIRINNKVIINRVVEAIATVILQIQTGKVKLPYILIIVIIIILILGLFKIKKHKRI